MWLLASGPRLSALEEYPPAKIVPRAHDMPACSLFDFKHKGYYKRLD